MILWQRDAVHMHRHQRCWLHGFAQMNAVAVVIRGVEDHFGRPRFHARTQQQGHQWNALPQSITHIFPAYLIADAHHRLILFFHWQRQDLLVREGEGVFNLPIDRQAPLCSVNRWIGEEVF